MKLTDLHKNKGLKINQSIKPLAAGKLAPAAVPDRREQRKLDQAKGLVPFACKLEGALINQLRTMAEERKVEMTELVTELLKAGLGAGEGKKAAKAKA